MTGERELLVCPECGGDRIGTVEKAEIWQSATFTLLPEGDAGAIGSGHEDEQGRRIDVEWDAYDSEDVGDTDTVGFFCRDCVGWIGRADYGLVPFIPRAEYEAKRAERLGLIGR